MANNQYNQLLTICKSLIFILKEAWINIRQNPKHICIFSNIVSIFTSGKKHTKSDIQKTWKEIFISYTRTLKHLKVCDSCTYQILIASNSIVNKSKKKCWSICQTLTADIRQTFTTSDCQAKTLGLTLQKSSWETLYSQNKQKSPCRRYLV